MAKLYLPSQFINNNYIYTYNGTYYTIRTNRNCYQQYTTTYCDSYYVYPNNDYLYTGPFSSSVTGVNNTIDVSQFTDNYMYSLNFDRSLIIAFILLLFLIYFPYKMISRMFGRWLKI